MLFRGIAEWIVHAGDVVRSLKERGLLPHVIPEYTLGDTPLLPAFEVYLLGEPGAGKSALGNLMLDASRHHAALPGTVPLDPPPFEEGTVSVARRFPDRYRGAQRFPSDQPGWAGPTARSQLPVALGMKVVELWGMGAGDDGPTGGMMRAILDASPAAAALVLVVRADRQIDVPERDFLVRIAGTHWRDRVHVVLNLRSVRHSPEEIIKLVGFVEEQCVHAGVKPRSVHAFSAQDGRSPVEDALEDFCAVIAGAARMRWSDANAAAVTAVLKEPLSRCESAVLETSGLADGSVGSLETELDSTRAIVDAALDAHDRELKAVLGCIAGFAEEAGEAVSVDLSTRSAEEVRDLPQEHLRRFRRESVQEIERSLGTCEDLAEWPVPDLKLRDRPNPGCAPLSAAGIAILATVVTAITALWVLTGILGAIAVALIVINVVLVVRARRAWKGECTEAIKQALDSQVIAARSLATKIHATSHDAALLAPEAHARLGRLDVARSTVAELISLGEEAASIVMPHAAAAARVRPARAAGRLSRDLAVSLSAGHALGDFLHENGFDLAAPDLFSRMSEMEAVLAQMSFLQTAQTLRGWLRPPIARREKQVYPYIEKIRMRWGEIGSRSTALAERLARKVKEARPHVEIEVRVEPLLAGTREPRVAVVEEALEALLGRILDEAVRHAWPDPATGGRVTLSWALRSPGEGGGGTGTPREATVVLDADLHAGRGFDEAGRRAFDRGSGGLARFLSDPERGALAWCCEVDILSVSGDRLWSRSVQDPNGTFIDAGLPPGTFTTRFRLVFPAVVPEGD